jgi:predicted O-methyltransferase YrrM
MKPELMLYRVWAYAAYLLKAKDEHSIHPPFLFDLYNDIIQSESNYYCFEQIEKLRTRMMFDERVIEVLDFGAGSSLGARNKRSVSGIAKHAVKPTKYAQLLFRLVNHFQCKNILELGTSLGLSTLYLAMANRKGKVISLEGAPEIAAIAKENFALMKCHHIHQICGEFSATLPDALSSFSSLDFVYLDGNHRLKPTIDYYQMIKPKLHEHSIVVVDDIHWSPEMNQAWHSIIKTDKAITLSIDLFGLGLLFYRPSLTRQAFVLKF